MIKLKSPNISKIIFIYFLISSSISIDHAELLMQPRSTNCLGHHFEENEFFTFKIVSSFLEK